jgi:hypothetical protein
MDHRQELQHFKDQNLAQLPRMEKFVISIGKLSSFEIGIIRIQYFTSYRWCQNLNNFLTEVDSTLHI